MKTIFRSLFLFVFVLAVPAAHADGTPALVLQGLNDANSGTHLGFDNMMNMKPATQFSKIVVQTHDAAGGQATQFASQPHNNWISARGPHVQESVVTAPEPGMLSMLGAGLIALGFYTRRKLGSPRLNQNLV
jgi:hypothetical protein